MKRVLIPLILAAMTATATSAIAHEFVYTITCTGTAADEAEAHAEADEEQDWRAWMGVYYCQYHPDLGEPIQMQRSWNWAYPNYTDKTVIRVEWTGSGPPPATAPMIPGFDPVDL